MQKRITRFVEDNSEISAERFQKLVMNTCELDMDIGTVLEGKDAVEEGIIDKMGNLSDALTCLYDMIDSEKCKKNRKSKKSNKNND